VGGKKQPLKKNKKWQQSARKPSKGLPQTGPGRKKETPPPENSRKTHKKKKETG